MVTVKVVMVEMVTVTVIEIATIVVFEKPSPITRANHDMVNIKRENGITS